jgi:hypothetical protein
MTATPPLLLGLPVRLLLGRLQMPELRGHRLLLFRLREDHVLREGHVRVAVVFALIDEDFVVGQTSQSITGHLSCR